MLQQVYLTRAAGTLITDCTAAKMLAGDAMSAEPRFILTGSPAQILQCFEYALNK